MAGDSKAVAEQRESAEPARIHVGTSGWAYKQWQPAFYPEKLAQTKVGTSMSSMSTIPNPAENASGGPNPIPAIVLWLMVFKPF